MPAWEALIEALARELSSSGIDASAWALGSARMIPTVMLVPAFGLKALPLVARVLLALALMAWSAPAVEPVAATGAPWVVTLTSQLLLGLPTAIGAAATLWAASMAGNVFGALLTSGHQPADFPTLDAEVSPWGILLGLAAILAFLTLGGPSRLAEGLATPQPPFGHSVPEVLRALLLGIRVAVLLAAPLVVLSGFVDLFHGLAARIARGVPLTPIVAPWRPLILIAALALLMERLLAELGTWMDARLPPP